MAQKIRIAIAFPGQGIQSVGMGADIAEISELAAGVFASADATLGKCISRLCWEGPQERLDATESTQPALLTYYVAVMKALGITPDVVMGHSLGEWAAIVAAGILSFEDALKLVNLRGIYMAEVASTISAKLVVVQGASAEELSSLIPTAATDVAIAAYNTPTSHLVSGAASAVENVASAALCNGWKIVPIKGTVPFHCPLLQPAADRLRADMERVEFRDPPIKIYSNATAAAITTGEQAREALLANIAGPLRWMPMCKRMLEEQNPTHFIQVGNGPLVKFLDAIGSSCQKVSVFDTQTVATNTQTDC